MRTGRPRKAGKRLLVQEIQVDKYTRIQCSIQQNKEHEVIRKSDASLVVAQDTFLPLPF